MKARKKQMAKLAERQAGMKGTHESIRKRSGTTIDPVKAYRMPGSMNPKKG